MHICAPSVAMTAGFVRVISCNDSFCHTRTSKSATYHGKRPFVVQNDVGRPFKACRGHLRPSGTTAVATESRDAALVASGSPAKAKVSIVAIVPANQHPLGVPWREVMSHVADRLTWEDSDIKVQTVVDETLTADEPQSDFHKAVRAAQIMLVLDIKAPPSLQLLLDGMHTVPTAIALGSHPQLEAATSLNNIALTKPWEKVAAATLPWSDSAKGTKVLQSVRDVYKRQTSDDLLFMLLVLIDAYITEVQSHLHFVFACKQNKPMHSQCMLRSYFCRQQTNSKCMHL